MDSGAPKQPSFSMASPFICESEGRVSREAWKAFDEAVRSWDEAYKCVAWTGSAGRDSEGGYKLFAGLNLLPDEDALKELWVTLNRLVGQVNFTVMIYDKTTEEEHHV